MVDKTKKFYVAAGENDFSRAHATYDEAIERANRQVAAYAASGNSSYKYFVFEAVATIQSPMPEAVVTKLA